ncbi:MAG TPA: hypothetical protein VH641_10090 [Streptosporangiaceae bacterium]|jgi:hypothetical protein
MSTGAEQELKERLGRVVGAVTPSPAPVDRAMRRGSQIRARRRVTALACLAGAAVVAVAVPVALHARPPSAVRSHLPHHTVTVHPGGGHSGLVAYGTIDGKPWQVRALQPQRGQQCWSALGTQGCGSPALDGSDPAELNDSSDRTLTAVYGPVSAKAAYLRATLTGGRHLTLHPVTVYGTREVAFAAPTSDVVSVTAYSGTGEIATAVPLHSPDGSLEFSAWLRPGQRPLPRITRLIGSGHSVGTTWTLTAYQGPWGMCLVPGIPHEASSVCLATLRAPGTSFIGSYLGPPPPVIAYFQASAATEHVVITFSDGTQTRVAAVSAGARKYFAFTVGQGVHAVRWTTYNRNRQEIASHRTPNGI